MGYESAMLAPELQGGDAGAFSFALSSVVIQADKVELPHPGITVIVGGNNSGKSTMLRETALVACHGVANVKPRLVTEVAFARAGTTQDLAAWLTVHAPARHRPGSTPEWVSPGGKRIPVSLTPTWERRQDALDALGDLLIHQAEARSRYSWSEPASRRDDIGDPPRHPLHGLEDSRERMAELSRLFDQAFGKPLTLDRLSGKVGLRVGRTIGEAPPIDDVSDTYHRELVQLPLINEQGDGMIFMLGVLIPVLAATYPVVLIDEPEAFLHPPQAYLMGQSLRRIAHESQIQAIVATHDRNVLRGVLSERKGDAKVVRIDRAHDDTATTHSVHVARLADVGAHPMLRFSNILDGLFHRLVVLAEGERDCVFYQAVLASMHPHLVHEVLFVPTHGVGSMPQYAQVLAGSGVPIIASPDLDILSDKTPTRALVIALGGKWDDELERAYRQATSQLTNNTIATRVKREGWSALNAAVPARDALRKRLAQVGVVPVPVGELERFHPDAAENKKEWLGKALAASAHTKSAAREHVGELVRPLTDSRGLPTLPDLV